jgi:hypothetical protein
VPLVDRVGRHPSLFAASSTQFGSGDSRSVLRPS